MRPQDLKSLRLSLGWSTEHTAELLGYSVKTWESMEAGGAAIHPAVDLIMRRRSTRDPPSSKTLLPAHLTSFRKAFGLTQALAAALVDTSRVTWNRWERGKVPVPAYLTPLLRGIVTDLKNLGG